MWPLQMCIGSNRLSSSVEWEMTFVYMHVCMCVCMYVSVCLSTYLSIRLITVSKWIISLDIYEDKRKAVVADRIHPSEWQVNKVQGSLQDSDNSIPPHRGGDDPQSAVTFILPVSVWSRWAFLQLELACQSLVNLMKTNSDSRVRGKGWSSLLLTCSQVVPRLLLDHNEWHISSFCCSCLVLLHLQIWFFVDVIVPHHFTSDWLLSWLIHSFNIHWVVTLSQ